jgi:hypothetical protein
MIESVADRRGSERARPMGLLLRSAAPLFEHGAAREVVVASILGFLGKLMPDASVRLLDVGEFALVGTGDAFYVDVPRATDRPARRLLVDFLRGGRLETGHLELLRLTAHLVALADDVERVSAPPPAPPEISTPPAPTPAAASPSLKTRSRKVIVRYRDGRLLKGHCFGFHPSSGQVHVAADAGDPASSRVTVPLSHLKALFFVHELEGRAGLPAGAAKPRGDLLRGRSVTITFMDGETLVGTTLTYSAEAPGFFVLPVDESSNNQQIFVVNGAVRHMQFA